MNSPKIFWWSCALLALLKVLLIGDLEIHGDPYDDHGYAISASQYYWGVDARANWLFIRPPGFPLFGSAVMATGLPYRVGIELFFLAGAAWFCAGLMRARIPAWTSFLGFAALVLHPWTLVLFNAYLSEPLYLSLHLFLFGGMIRVILRERLSIRDPALWVIGFSLAWLLLTRREGPLLYATFAVGFALRLTWARWGLAQPWPALARNTLWLLIPILLVQALTLGVRAANYAKWEIFATNEQEAPGFSGLLDTLYAIETPDASHYAPVTRKSLKMAIEASPKLREIEEGLLHTDNHHIAFGEALTGRENELGPWMWWRLYDAVAHAGIYTSPKAADAWMREAAAELDEALRTGDLPRRTLRLPFPFDPNIGHWLPSVPERCWEAVRRLVHQPVRYNWREKEASLPRRYQAAFDRAANRRRAHLERDYMHLAGHAIPTAGPATFVTVETADGSVVAAAPIRETDPGMREHTEAVAGTHGLFPTSFYLRAPPVEEPELFLAVWRDERVVARRALHELSVPYWSGYPGDSDPGLLLSVDRWSNPAWERAASLRVHVTGWAFAPDAPLDHVSLENEAGQLLKAAPFSIERPDLHELFRDRAGREPHLPLGFDIRTPTRDTQEVFLDFWHEGQRIHRLALSSLSAPHWDDLERGTAGAPFLYGLDRLELPTRTATAPSLRSAIRHAIHRHYQSALWLLAGLTLLAAVVLPAQRHIPNPAVETRSQETGVVPFLVNWSAAVVFVLLALALLGRGIFYGLVEAIVVPGEARYVENAAPIAATAILLFAFLLARVINHLRPRGFRNR